MSMAIRASNARQRATIAAQIIKHQKNISTRCFEDCFEMLDGDEVMDHLTVKAGKDPVLARAILEKCSWLGSGDYNVRLLEAVNACLQNAPEMVSARRSRFKEPDLPLLNGVFSS